MKKQDNMTIAQIAQLQQLLRGIPLTASDRQTIENQLQLIGAVINDRTLPDNES